MCACVCSRVYALDLIAMNVRRTIIFLSVVALGLGACVSNTEDAKPPLLQDADVAVTFSPNIGTAKDSRATYPEGSVGELTTEKLEGLETGFGVYAFYSEDEKYGYEKDGIGDAPFNFMWNQQVTYESAGSYWTYEPLKYWPNDNAQADNNGAIGSKEHSYVSFFAYAPYTGNAGDTGNTGNTEEESTDNGIVGMTHNSVGSGGSFLTYRLSSDKLFIDDNVDLLWASRPNMWKMMTDEDGEHPGYVDGKVKFNFKHALSKFTITVQGLFDHVSSNDQSTQYPDDVDENTRILIESVDFGSSPLMKEGNMYIVPHPDNNTLPYWKLDKKNKMNLTIKDLAINSRISDAYTTDNGTSHYHEGGALSGENAVETKEKFKMLPEGVTNKEVPLFEPKDGNSSDLYYLVIPNNYYMEENDTDTDPMQIHIVYHVITYDQNLKLNKVPYCSIVENNITAEFSPNFVFEPNKQYKLRLLLGLTTVKFELLMADGWDVPLVMDPVVIDWHIEKNEYDIE